MHSNTTDPMFVDSNGNTVNEGQQVPFSDPCPCFTFFVYLSAAACISGGTKFGHMWAQEFLESQSKKGV